jgi:hypothetical protein
MNKLRGAWNILLGVGLYVQGENKFIFRDKNILKIGIKYFI